ncbi:hypothetical protein FHS79_002550 [Polymorphobacter multimanifer]|uniref:DUF4376 domain-containing protein n=1 Tax=Polymorphobacter multimanifer TaxID=1070431 RepID=A0A841LEX6_9SPHN|nr:hypothetical protein [Polymorphobacter multimanifer]
MHDETGELRFVETMGGMGPEWLVVAEEAPEGLADTPWLVVEGALVPDLAAVRAVQRALINGARDAARDGGVDTPSGRFDSDAESRGMLNGAVTTAMLATQQGGAFSVDWTRADDSEVKLDAQAVAVAGVAVAAWVSAVHERSRVLKARIDAAETVEEIRAVIWSLVDEED